MGLFVCCTRSNVQQDDGIYVSFAWDLLGNVAFLAGVALFFIDASYSLYHNIGEDTSYWLQIAAGALLVVCSLALFLEHARRLKLQRYYWYDQEQSIVEHSDNKS